MRLPLRVCRRVAHRTAIESGVCGAPVTVSALGFQVGLFRKSGVRSRIQQLRLACEAAGSDEHTVSFEGFSAFDVADLVKQYLRELPEVVLTSRVSQMLITIYQCK